MLSDPTEDQNRAEGESTGEDCDSDLWLAKMLDELMGQVGRLERNMEWVTKGMEEARNFSTQAERGLEGLRTEVSNLTRRMAERDAALAAQTAVHTAQFSATHAGCAGTG